MKIIEIAKIKNTVNIKISEETQKEIKELIIKNLKKRGYLKC